MNTTKQKVSMPFTYVSYIPQLGKKSKKKEEWLPIPLQIIEIIQFFTAIVLRCYQAIRFYAVA